MVSIKFDYLFKHLNHKWKLEKTSKVEKASMRIRFLIQTYSARVIQEIQIQKLFRAKNLRKCHVFP